MAGMEWKIVRGYEFTPEEAQSASDFGEIVGMYGLDPDAAYHLFKEEGTALKVGHRLFFAERIPIDRATILLLCDPDERIRGVVEERLREIREKESGGIIQAVR
jgi:hypothetical protein